MNVLEPKPKVFYFRDAVPGCPSRVEIGRAGASIYGRDGAIVATLGTATMDRIVAGWAERQPAKPYHFLGAEAEGCA